MHFTTFKRVQRNVSNLYKIFYVAKFFKSINNPKLEKINSNTLTNGKKKFFHITN